jgi:6,7-dimethyl-8-ribityllumazine synthase
MPIKRIVASHDGPGRTVGIVLSRFNPDIGEGLLAGALRALREAGVADDDVTLVSVPGALETPLALQRLAQTRRYDALVALGAVIRGDTYHFEVVANESAAGVATVQLDMGIPVGNGILTCDTDEQARARMDAKGYEAAQAALELANLLATLDLRLITRRRGAVRASSRCRACTSGTWPATSPTPSARTGRRTRSSARRIALSSTSCGPG